MVKEGVTEQGEKGQVDSTLAKRKSMPASPAPEHRTPDVTSLKFKELNKSM